MAKSGKRTTFQFAIPEELQNRMNVLRDELPGIGSPAPLLRMTLEQWVENFEAVLEIKRRGGTEAEMQSTLTDVLGRNLARVIAGAVVQNEKKGGSTG